MNKHLLVAVDDSGNCSDPVYATFTALDTIKPVLTGEMTIEAVGEAKAEPEGPQAETPADEEQPPPGNETPADTPADTA